MANYCCTIRTNYFRVNDENKFRDFFENVQGCEDSVELFEKKDENGKTLFGFGTYGGILGVINDPDEDYDILYDTFTSDLQRYVADDDAIIIFEVGNEKLRYIIGSATIITKSSINYIDITSAATKKASEILGNSSWETCCVY